MLRQRSRPYLFSNTLAPAIVGAGIAALELLDRSDDQRRKLKENTAYFRRRIAEAGLDIRPGEHPIVPIMLYESALAQKMAAAMLERGIYVVGFFYPVVPQGQARIRVQISAAHERTHLDRAVEAFAAVGRELDVVRA